MRTRNSAWLAARVFATTELVTKTETFLVSYVATTDQTGVIVRREESYGREAGTFYDEARTATAAMFLRPEQKTKTKKKFISSEI
jgi:hypothetical protein